MGKNLGEIYSYAREVGFKQRYAYVASGNGVGQIEYIGYAYPSALESEAKWQIRKYTYNSSNRMTEANFANGSDDFNQIWDNRALLSYS